MDMREWPTLFVILTALVAGWILFVRWGHLMADWITTQQAAELSGYHPEHIRRLVREGRINARKFGIVWMINKQSLLAFVQNAERSEDKRRGAKSS